MGELVRVGRADSFCLMNRFQACIWVRTKTGSPSSLALFFILGGGERREMLVIQSPQWLLSSSRCTERGEEGKEFEGDKYKTAE